MRIQVFPILVGIITCVIFVLFAYSILTINVNENNEDKRRITDLVKSEISIQSRDHHVFADLISAFYASTEQVTEKEFETFVSYVLSDIPELKNIAVMQDKQIIHSYPIKDILLNPTDSSYDTVMVDQMPAILIKHTESPDDVIVLLFIDPDRFISFPDILQEPYKVEVLINDSTVFYDTSSNDDSYFTDYQIENTLVVSKNISMDEYGNTPQILTIMIWENNFTNYLYAPLGIMLIGGIMSVLTSFLAYKNTLVRTKLQEKNKILYDHNIILEENKKHTKQLQTLLLASDEKHRNLFNLSPLAIVVLDLNGNFTSCNSKAAEIFGYSKNDMIGRHFTSCISEDDINRQIKLFKKVIFDGIIMKESVFCKNKNGIKFQMIVSASAMKDKNAKTSGVIAVLYHPSTHDEGLQTSLLSQ